MLVLVLGTGNLPATSLTEKKRVLIPPWLEMDMLVISEKMSVVLDIWTSCHPLCDRRVQPANDMFIVILMFT